MSWQLCCLNVGRIGLLYRPIAFASCHSLNPAEHKCAQMDKEGLASVYRVTKLHQYLLDCKFIINFDNMLASLKHL